MTNAISIAQYGSSNPTFRNRIINGAMAINQRATSVTTAAYTVDRWFYNASVSTKATVSQDTSTYPSGYISSLKAISSSAYSVGATDYFGLYQSIEGLNIADLGWGTSNAKTVTLSFQVYSSLTGTFGGSVNNSGYSRSYPFSYTVSSANTWTAVSVTIPGDTSGTWLTTNGIGMTVNFSLGTGSTYSGTAGSWAGVLYISTTGATSVVGTNGATFYITGVQLEAGSTATPFEYRQYGTELALCQRYYEKSYDQATASGTSVTGTYAGLHITATVNPTSSSYMGGTIQYKVTKRSNAGFQYWDAAGTASRYSTLTGGGLSLANNVGALTSVYSGDSQYGFTVLPGIGLMSLFGWAVSAEL